MVAEVGREQRHLGRDVVAGSVPVDQTGHGKGVPQVVKAGSTPCSDTDLGALAQLAECLPDRGVDQASPGHRDEEARRHRPRVLGVAAGGVALERAEGARMEGDHAGLGELRLPDQHNPGHQVHIGVVQADHFADAHPGHGQQPDHGRERLSEQRRAYRDACLTHQRVDIGRGVDERGSPALPGREQSERWDLSRRVDPSHVAGKAPGNTHPSRSHLGAWSGFHGPGQGSRDGHRRRPGRVEVSHEAGQQPGCFGEFVPQTAAQREVVAGILRQGAHRSAPGHGRAMVRSPPTSTLA